MTNPKAVERNYFFSLTKTLHMFQKPVVLLTGFYVFRQRILGNTALVSNNVFLLSFVMISSVVSKSQDFKVGMPIFKPF